MWVTVVVVLVVALMVGPIMMLQPNRSQRHATRLRALAEKHKLHIRLGQNPASGEPRELAVYSRSVNPKTEGSLRPWFAARQALEHELNFAEDWDWVRGGHAPEKLHAALKDWLPTLPAPIRAVVVTDQSVGIYWTERFWLQRENWDDSAQESVAYIIEALDRLFELSRIKRPDG